MQLTVGTQGWLSIWKAVITGQTGKIVCICGNTFCEIQHSSFRKKKKKKKNQKTLFFFFFAPMAYGRSPGRGQIRAAGLHHSHSNTRSRPWDPGCFCNLHHSSWQCQILNPLSRAWAQTWHPHGDQSHLLPLSHNGNS